MPKFDAYSYIIPKWQTRKSRRQRGEAKRKPLIQDIFKTDLGLLIDMPEPDFSNSIDGNTAPCFFENTSISARIIGVDE